MSAEVGKPPRRARSAGLYAQHCASCHGEHLAGQPNWRVRQPNGRLPAPPHDASGHTWHHSDARLLAITKNGASGIVPGYESDMPAFKGVLSDRADRPADPLGGVRDRFDPGRLHERAEAAVYMYEGRARPAATCLALDPRDGRAGERPGVAAGS